MSLIKLGLLGVCVVMIGAMAMSAGSAQAALSWLVLNSSGTAIEIKKEGEGVNLLVDLAGEADSQDVTLLARALHRPIIITCSKFELENIHLGAEGKLDEDGRVTFSSCEGYESGTLTNPLGCHVHTTGSPAGTIKTTEGKGELVLHELSGGGKEVLVKIEPKEAGGLFAEIKTELCTLPTNNPIGGVLYLKDGESRVSTHEIRHLVIEGPLTSLVYGADSIEHLETSLDGSGWIKLAGEHAGLTWAAMSV